jgi:hypothetical protein
VSKTKRDKDDVKMLLTGLIIIWPNEKSGLPTCLPTALTKAIICVHKPHECANSEELSRINNDISSECSAYSGFFRCFLVPVDTAMLAEEKYKITSKITRSLEADVETDCLAKNERVISNHAYVIAAMRTVLQNANLSPDDVCMYSDILFNFILQRSIPTTFENVNKQLTPTKNMTTSVFSPDQLWSEFMAMLSSVDTTEFFQLICFGDKDVGFGVKLWTKAQCQASRQSESLFKKYTPTKRRYFVSPESDTEWYKRDQKGMGKCVYGSFRFGSAYVVPRGKVPPLVLELIEKQISILAPSKYSFLYVSFHVEVSK